MTNFGQYYLDLLIRIKDSKKITEKNREDIYTKLMALGDDVFMCEYDAVSAGVVDEINILPYDKAFCKLLIYCQLHL